MPHSLSLPTYQSDLSNFVSDLRDPIFRVQADVAKYFRVSRTTIGRYESGQIIPPIGYIAALASAMASRYSEIMEKSDYDVISSHLLKEVNTAILDSYFLTTARPFHSWKELMSAGSQYMQEEGNIESSPNQQRKVEETDSAKERQLSLLPPIPPLFIGRTQEVKAIKSSLTRQANATVQSDRPTTVVIRGMAGIGKTTLVSQLAHDNELASIFSDGIFWVSLGEAPNLLSKLIGWGRTLGLHDLLYLRDIDEIRQRLTGFFQNKKALFLIDDVWDVVHAVPFLLGAPGCASIVTTRSQSISFAIASSAEHIWNLPELSEEHALEMLRKISPEVSSSYPEESLELVRIFEGLPLAIRVAGYLLNVESKLGWGVRDLLNELYEGSKLLEADAPADLADPMTGVLPKVNVLLQRSTDRLDSRTRRCFAEIGAFTSRPATFSVKEMAYVWNISDPKPIIRTLIERGLLERLNETETRFRMHSVLTMHAKLLYEKEYWSDEEL